MTRDACAYCGRPVTAAGATFVGPVKFCTYACITDWYSLPQHDRRHAARPVRVERRQP